MSPCDEAVFADDSIALHDLRQSPQDIGDLLELAGNGSDAPAKPQPIRAQQHDLGTPDLLLRGIAIPHQRLQLEAIRTGDGDGNSSSHAPDSHEFGCAGILFGNQMSKLIH
jgi:hypothetical protein